MHSCALESKNIVANPPVWGRRSTAPWQWRPRHIRPAPGLIVSIEATRCCRCSFTPSLMHEAIPAHAEQSAHPVHRGRNIQELAELLAGAVNVAYPLSSSPTAEKLVGRGLVLSLVEQIRCRAAAEEQLGGCWDLSGQKPQLELQLAKGYVRQLAAAQPLLSKSPQLRLQEIPRLIAGCRCFTVTQRRQPIRYIYFDAEQFLRQHLPPAARSAPAAEHWAAAPAALSGADSAAGRVEPPCYQPNQWVLLEPLAVRLLVVDGADPAALQATSDLLQAAPVVGVDMEFISGLKHDSSEVALVQCWLPGQGAAVGQKAGKRAGRGGKAANRPAAAGSARAGQAVLLDVYSARRNGSLARMQAVLAALLASRSCLKVLHGCGQDVAALRRCLGLEQCCALVDTQVLHAAVRHFQLALPPEPLETSMGISLLGLLQQLQLRHPRPAFELLGKQRGQCKWAVRPLTLPMLEYAIGDAMHLPAAAELLQEQLWELRGLAMAARVCEGLLVESQGLCLYGRQVPAAVVAAASAGTAIGALPLQNLPAVQAAPERLPRPESTRASPL